MGTPELLYDLNSVAITVILFFLILLSSELGFRIGRFVQHHTDAEIKSLTGSVQASILGLLALLLGFTFSMSMQRFNDRSQAVIAEANDIGSTVLRAKLLPQKYQADAAAMLGEYIDLRIAVGRIDLTRSEERRQYQARISDLQERLWSMAVAAANDDPRPISTGAFVTALNNAIDSQGRRQALLQMHVPEPVLFLLFIVFIASGGMLGYSSGLGGRRIVAPTALVSFLIALIVFIIIDLDRPKRGLIQVNQAVLHELKQLHLP